MKQHVTPEQLKGISENAIKKLQKWWSPIRGDIVYSTIKQNIFRIETKPSEDSVTGYVELSDYEYPSNVVEFTAANHLIPLLSIGQMIEYLGETLIGLRQSQGYYELTYKPTDSKPFTGSYMILDRNLCDLLWRVVKSKLEGILKIEIPKAIYINDASSLEVIETQMDAYKSKYQEHPRLIICNIKEKNVLRDEGYLFFRGRPVVHIDVPNHMSVAEVVNLFGERIKDL